MRGLGGGVTRGVALIGAAALLVGACAKREDASARSDSAAGQPMAKMDSGATAGTAGSSTAPSSGPAAANAGMKGVLDQLASLNGKPIETLTPAEARKQPSPKDAVVKLLMAQGKSTEPTQLVPGVTTADRTIPGPGGALPVRIYTPEGNGPFPVIVYYHGGGWVIANKDVYDPGARALSKDAGAVVVSVDYRLAPEHKFPAQHDDALATYEWTMKNAASIKGDPNRIALAGESAGGNLAVATAMLARDKGDKLPVAIASVYPIAQPDTTTASYVENASAKPLNRPMMEWFFKQTIRTPADLKDPRIDLVHANLKGLPPVAIVNAQIDPLRDDGAMLEQSLKSAGVSVDRKVYDGVAHEFFGMGAVLDEAKDANQWAADHLKSAFGNK